MSEITYVNLNVDRLNLSTLATKHKPQVKPASTSLKRTDQRDLAKVSDGFVVIGFTPEMWESIPVLYADRIEEYEQDPTKNKHPGTYEEFERSWINKTKPTRARTKPYEIASAADTCAELCRKAGWMHVRASVFWLSGITCGTDHVGVSS